MRAWAHAEPVVGGPLRRIDRRRWELFASTIQEATVDPDGDLLADLMLGLAIGLTLSWTSKRGSPPSTSTEVVWTSMSDGPSGK